MSELVAVRQSFSQLWARMAGFWGVAPATARLYAWLLSVERGLSAEELVEALQMSRGAVSMSARELVEYGLVVQEQEPGSRRLIYRAEADLEKAIRSIVQARKRREWDPILVELRGWIQRLEAERSPEAAGFRERLESIEALVGLADSMAESFLKGGMVQRLGLGLLVSRAQSKQRRKRSKS